MIQPLSFDHYGVALQLKKNGSGQFSDNWIIFWCIQKFRFIQCNNSNIDSKTYSSISFFGKNSIQSIIQNFIFQKYSIPKIIHFRISEEIQFKNIIQNWIFFMYSIQKKYSFNTKRSTSQG